MEKKIGNIITITILFVIIAGLTGYILYDKVFSKEVINNNQGNQNNNDNSTVKELSDAEKKEIEEDLMDDIEDYFYVFWNKTSISELSNREKQILGIIKFAKDNDYENLFNLGSIPATSMEKSLNLLFKDNMTINHENIYGYSLLNPCNHLNWKYDEDVNIYMYQNDGHGACNVYDIYDSVDSFKIENGKYIVSVKYVFGYGCEGEFATKVYGDYNDAINDKNSVLTITNQPKEGSWDYVEDFVENSYGSIKDKLNTYVYTFEKIDNNYKLSNFELVK